MQKVVVYKRQREEGTLTLQGCVDIFEAAMLRAAVQRALSDRKATILYVDFAGVERLDVSAAQILLALSRDVEATGRQFSIRGIPAITAKTLASLGISLEP